MEDFELLLRFHCLCGSVRVVLVFRRGGSRVLEPSLWLSTSPTVLSGDPSHFGLPIIVSSFSSLTLTSVPFVILARGFSVLSFRKATLCCVAFFNFNFVYI